MKTSDIRDIALIVVGLVVLTVIFVFLFSHAPTVGWILFVALLVGAVELAFAPLRTLWNKLR